MVPNDTLFIYRPGRSFPPVSVTGSKCDLMCAHCEGKSIRCMHPAVSPEELVRKAEEVKAAGGKGMLISGGCDITGKVPLTKMIGAIKRIVDMGLEVNVHAGLIGNDEAAQLVDAGVSRFSADIHRDPVIIRNVLNLSVDPEAYIGTIGNIISAGGKVIPHITAGFGTEDMLLSAQALKDVGLNDITMLALVGNGDIPSLPEEGALKALSILLEMGFNVTLGCMRSRSYRTLETDAIRMGIRRIANPSGKTVRWAKENGFTIIEIDKCCSF